MPSTYNVHDEGIVGTSKVRNVFVKDFNMSFDSVEVLTQGGEPF